MSTFLARRASAFPWIVFFMVLLISAVGAVRMLSVVERPDHHISRERLDTLNVISKAIQPQSATTDSAACPEMDNAVKAANQRLKEVALPTGAYVLSMQALQSARTNCVQLARDIDREMNRSLLPWRVPENWREHAFNRDSAVWKDVFWRPRPADLHTPDGWRVLPGCLRNAAGTPLFGYCEGFTVHRLLSAVTGDQTLMEHLRWRLARATRQGSGVTVEFRGKAVERGHNLRLGLDANLQSRAAALVACMTGVHEECAGLLSEETLTADWRYQPGGLRASAAAVVVLDVETGLVRAAAGGTSKCFRDNLQRDAEVIRVGGALKRPLFRPGEPCAQYPDRRGALQWSTPHPMLWTVGPGSTMKSLALLAALEQGLISPQEDARYQRIIARSRDDDGRQEVPQRLARASAARLIQLLTDVGFARAAPEDLMLGNAVNPMWPAWTRGGAPSASYHLTEAEFQQIQEAKRGGANADRIYGTTRVAEYLKAQRLSVTAIGGGDVRVSAFALADWARKLELRGGGRDHASPTRFADADTTTQRRQDLRFASVRSVQRLIQIMGAASSPKLGGTVVSACVVVMGRCPEEGFPGLLFAKTGTADATLGEGSPWSKGGVLPAKVFMGVFTGGDGRQYAVGAMALRARTGTDSAVPDRSNAAAELALLIYNYMNINNNLNMQGAS